MRAIRMTDAQHRAMTESKAKLAHRKPRALEKDVQATIRSFLSLHGWWVMRVNQGGGRFKNKTGPERFVKFTDLTGVSDLMAAKGSVWAWIECKRPGESATLPQQQFLASVRRHGGLGFVATCVEDVQRELRL